MKKLTSLMYDKKAEFFVRLALAVRTLQPVKGAPFVERIFYRHLAKFGENFFMSTAASMLLMKERKMAEEACKHDMAGADSKFCPGCGATLSADPEVENVIGRVVRKILGEYDVKPKKPASEGGGTSKETKKSLADKLGIAKGKK